MCINIALKSHRLITKTKQVKANHTVNITQRKHPCVQSTTEKNDHLQSTHAKPS